MLIPSLPKKFSCISGVGKKSIWGDACKKFQNYIFSIFEISLSKHVITRKVYYVDFLQG